MCNISLSRGEIIGVFQNKNHFDYFIKYLCVDYKLYAQLITRDSVVLHTVIEDCQYLSQSCTFLVLGNF